MHQFNRPRRSALKLAAGVAVAALSVAALTACTSARNAPQASPSPEAGGTATFAVALDANPAGVFRTLETNYPWLHNVFETLTAPNAQDPENPDPLLATEWQLAEDGLTMDITLRDDVTFHS